jgi:AraC-like DNA-binding protein
MLKHVKNVKSHLTDGVSQIWFTPVNQYYHRTIYKDIQPKLTKTLPLRLDFVNDEHCFEKYYRRREASEVFAIELVLKGSMYFVQNEKKYRIMAGSIFLVHHDHDNEFTTGPEGHCHRLACIFSGLELNALLHTTKLIEHDVIKLNNLQAVENTMRECFNELKDKKIGFRRRASILGYKLLLELEENLEQINTPDLLLRAVDLMEHHLSQQLSLKKLAQALNSAPTSLNRVFQQHFNISPINYFIGLKMEAAKSLLSNTNMQIQEVAQNTGYSSALYFSSEFKKRIGMSPREFRKTTIS